MGFKWDESGPVEKMLRLYTLLMFSRYPISLKDLAQRMNCSKQTIIRLIAQMETSGLGKILVEKIGREIFYKLEKPRDLAASLSLNADGLVQLALCREFLTRLLPPKMLESMAQSLEGALRRLPEGAEPLQKEIATSLSKGHIDYAPFEEILNFLIKGMAESRICLASYRSKRGNPEKKYRLAPIRLIAFHESLLISAFILDENDKPKYDDPAIFALHRFTTCSLTNRICNLEESRTAKTDFLGIMTADPFEISVRFSAEAATYVAERQWSEDQYITDLEDGSIILRLMVNNIEECLSWLLGFGEKAELLAPEWLRAKLRDITAEMYSYYR